MYSDEKSEKEIQEKINLLKILHRIYIENQKLGENIEHMLDIMEEIARLEKKLKEL
jgi:SMC interacting uncharacterized protein involved in chromosome segregation